jgi:CDP-diacylglycerol--glycerol-3-phosphate 3-phosphatidyltransferase
VRTDAVQPAATRPAVGVKIFNVANGLTVLRLLLVPVFLACLLVGGTGWQVAAFAVFGVAALTDQVDGKLARSLGLVTDFGTIADPIADKALIGAALLALAALGRLPWWVAGLILAREVAVTALRLAVLRHAVIPASRGGKVKTALQTLAVGLYVLPLHGAVATTRAWLLAAAVVATVLTGFDYLARAWALRRSAR